MPASGFHAAVAEVNVRFKQPLGLKPEGRRFQNPWTTIAVCIPFILVNTVLPQVLSLGLLVKAL